jgi:hypothetical protein
LIATIVLFATIVTFRDTGVPLTGSMRTVYSSAASFPLPVIVELIAMAAILVVHISCRVFIGALGAEHSERTIGFRQQFHGLRNGGGLARFDGHRSGHLFVTRLHQLDLVPGRQVCRPGGECRFQPEVLAPRRPAFVILRAKDYTLPVEQDGILQRVANRHASERQSPTSPDSSCCIRSADS